MAKIEDILFWILILTVIAVAIWLAFGSPSFESSLLMLIIFVAGSEILLWKSLFKVDNRTAIGFERVNSDVKEIKRDISLIKQNTESIDTKINKIEDSIININKKLKVK